MREKQIMVMLKRPGCEPELEPLFDNTLEAFQEAVGVKGDEFASIPARHIPLARRILRGDRPCE